MQTDTQEKETIMEPVHRQFLWKRPIVLMGIAAFTTAGTALAANAADAAHTLKTVAQIAPELRPQGVPLDYLVTPVGFFSPSCVKRVQDDTAPGAARCTQPHYRYDGARVEPNGAFFPGKIKASAAAYYSGPIEDAHLTLKDPIGKFQAEWVVPKAPADIDTQSVYYSIEAEGIGPSNSATVLRSELSYEMGFPNPGAWELTVWVQSEGKLYYSGPVEVNEGDVIVGDITKKSGNTWSVRATDKRTGEAVGREATVYEMQKIYGGVLRVRDVRNCNQFPSGSPFVFSKVEAFAPNLVDRYSLPWTLNPPKSISLPCKFGVSTGPDSSIILSY
ncbi:MAG TPA: hypothetical protein VIM98_14480 [Dyella sp.]|uniref:hypothetical protein n=1 Tax=Dyella sp. TaxID=1869338 RepID=UPI002F929044